MIIKMYISKDVEVTLEDKEVIDFRDYVSIEKEKNSSENIKTIYNNAWFVLQKKIIDLYKLGVKELIVTNVFVKRKLRNKLYNSLNKLSKYIGEDVYIKDIFIFEDILEFNKTSDVEGLYKGLQYYSFMEIPIVGYDCDEVEYTGEKYFKNSELNVVKYKELKNLYTNKYQFLFNDKLVEELSQTNEKYNVFITNYEQKNAKVKGLNYLYNYSIFNGLSRSMYSKTLEDGTLVFPNEQKLNSLMYMNYLYSYKNNLTSITFKDNPKELVMLSGVKLKERTKLIEEYIDKVKN